MSATVTTAIRLPPAEPKENVARTLDRIVETSSTIDGIWAHDVAQGDWIVIKTKNSTYSLACQAESVYRVAGGWFAAERAEDRDVRIAGCTWGGAVIHTKLIAAVGMFLEFDNGVRTTRIREARLIKNGSQTGQREH